MLFGLIVKTPFANFGLNRLEFLELELASKNASGMPF